MDVQPLREARRDIGVAVGNYGNTSHSILLYFPGGEHSGGDGKIQITTT
jgi:hypothetical protein